MEFDEILDLDTALQNAMDEGDMRETAMTDVREHTVDPYMDAPSPRAPQIPVLLN